MKLSRTVNFGLITGLFLTVYSAVLYAMGINAMTNWILAILIFPIILFLVFFFALRVRKQEYGGYWSFRQAFVCLFLIQAISSIVFVVWNILLYNVIDTTLAADMSDKIMSDTLVRMEDWGVAQDQIDETLKGMEGMIEQFSVKGQFISYFKQLIWSAALSLVGAAFIRKSAPKPTAPLDAAI